MMGLQQGYLDIRSMPVFERKWYVDRFIQQKQKEYEEYQKAAAQAKAQTGSAKGRRR